MLAECSYGSYPLAKTVEESKKAFTVEAYGQFKRAKADKPATKTVSLDAMLATAKRQWPGGKADFVRVWLPGDANSYVEVRRHYLNEVTMHLDQIYLDAATGQVLTRFEAPPIMPMQRFMVGAHRPHFDHWLLRWMYFSGGLAGCIMNTTGFLCWLESRRRAHAKYGLAGVRVVEALTVFSRPGIVIATLAFFVANRLLPESANVASYGWATLEIWAFNGVWLGTLVHASLRCRAAWREQALGIAALAGLPVVLNWVTTGQHLGDTLSQGLWAVFSMDLLLLSSAGLAGRAASKLRGKATQKVALSGRSGVVTEARHA